MNNIVVIKNYLKDLQHDLCRALTVEDTQREFKSDEWNYITGKGGGCTRVLEGCLHIEKAGVNISHIQGPALPAAATVKRPELVGYAFEAIGLSSVIHPCNPYVPTAHLNVRYFQAEKDGHSVWWFGGGFDLT